MSELVVRGCSQPILSTPNSVRTSPPHLAPRIGHLPEEILLEIVTYLHKIDVTQVVRVSRVFWRIAIPFIWRELEELEGNGHLCHLLKAAKEPHHGDKDEDETAASSNESTGLYRSTLHIHAHLVKSLTLLLWNEDDSFGLIGMLEDLGAQGVVQLLPALEELRIILFEISDVESNVGPALKILISPTITTFELNLNTDSVDEDDALDNLHASHSILDLLAPLQLKILRISSTDTFLQCSEGLSRKIGLVISQQKALTSIDLSDLRGRESAPVTEASYLPHLARIKLVSTRRTNLPVAATPSVVGDPWLPIQGLPNDSTILHHHRRISFPSLLHLAAQLPPADVETLLRRVTSTKLDTLELNLVQPGSGTTFTRTLADVGRFLMLRTIHINHSRIHGTWRDIRPILSCPCAQNVSLSGHRISTVIGDSELRSMAEAWPLLQSLAIVDDYLEIRRLTSHILGTGTDTNSLCIPSASLIGLTPFALHCPLLTSIAISINARGTLSETSVQGVGLKVKSVRFPNSLVLVEGEHHVADFIKRMWPNQRHSALKEEDDSWARIWKLVSD